MHTRHAFALTIAPTIMGASLALGLANVHPIPASADPGGCFTADWAPIECPAGEILLSEIHNPDLFPVCNVEDCSDQPGQIGMWLDDDTGNWWLSTGERESLLVIDDSAVTP